MESVMKLVALAVMLSVAMGEVSISLDISEEQVHPGSNITLNCRISGIGPGEIIYWQKGDKVEDSENIASQLIATNDLLSPMYQQLGRYKPSVVQVGANYLYIMHIYGVTEEESGKFACVIPRLSYQHDFKHLYVFEQAKEISFLNVTEDEESPLVLTEGEPQDIHCHVREVNPVPSITMKMGNRDVDNLDIKPEQKLHCTSSIDNCPLNIDFDVHAIAREHSATWMDDGEKLICRSHIKASKFNPMEVHRNVKVLYAPKMQCNQITRSALGKDRFNITCTVRMNPLPLALQEADPSAAYWQFKVDGLGDAKVLANQQIAEFSAFETPVNDTARNYTLTIDLVNPNHINVTYNLHVRNTIGQNTTGIMLMQDNTGTPPRPVGGAAAMLLSLTTLVLATIFSVSQQHH